MEITCGCQRRACSKASFTLFPAAMLITEKRSGKLSTMLSVLLPMEPVEPRMAMRFIKGSAYQDSAGGEVVRIARDVEQPARRYGEEQSVDAVEHTPMTRQQRAGVLHARSAL